MVVRALFTGLWVLAACMCAATPYRLPRYEQLATALHLQLADSLRRPHSEADSVAFCKGRAVYVRMDGFGDVSHIGYRLFSPAVREQSGHSPVFDFLERYLLELDLQLDGKQPGVRMDVDQVVVTVGSLFQLRDATPASQLAVGIEVIPRKMYRFSWTLDGREGRVTIPADSQLLFGGTVIDLEQMFIRNMQRMVPIAGDDAITDWSARQAKESGGALVIDGGTYQIDAIRGDVYLTRRSGRLQLLMDRKSPLRSVSNMVLTGMARQDIPLDVTFHVYGNRRDTLHVTLQQFIEYCKADGCRLYFGTKTIDDAVLTGTLFAYNERCAYTHMLSLTVPLGVIDGGEARVAGDAYVYIPLHDITEKYMGH